MGRRRLINNGLTAPELEALVADIILNNRGTVFTAKEIHKIISELGFEVKLARVAAKTSALADALGIVKYRVTRPVGRNRLEYIIPQRFAFKEKQHGRGCKSEEA